MWGKDGYYWISYCEASFPTAVSAIDGVKDYDAAADTTYEYDYIFSYEAGLKFSQKDPLYMRSYWAEADEVVKDVIVYVGGANSRIDVDIMQDVSAMNSYVFSSKGSINTTYPGWYTVTLNKPVLIRKGKKFGAVVKSDGYVGINSESVVFGSTAFNISGRWYSKAAGNKEYGWCIKATSTNDEQLVATAIAEEEEAARLRAAASAEILDLPAVKMTKPKAGKKKLTVRWKKLSKKKLKKIRGFQIQVATDPGFRHVVKTVKVSKKKKSKKITGLKKKTRYYVRIRSYGAARHYSRWSAKRRIRVK